MEQVEPEWQPILHGSNQIVLYNPTSHALSIQRHSSSSSTGGIVRRGNRQLLSQCPYCHRDLPDKDHEGNGEDSNDADSELEEYPRSRVPNYFQLLQISNETASIPSTPMSETPGSMTPSLNEDGEEMPFSASNMAEGYFEAFFQEECRLGMGANGSVYLCRVRTFHCL